MQGTNKVDKINKKQRYSKEEWQERKPQNKHNKTKRGGKARYADDYDVLSD